MRLGIGSVEFGKEPPVKLTQRGLTLASASTLCLMTKSLPQKKVMVFMVWRVDIEGRQGMTLVRIAVACFSTTDMLDPSAFPER